MGKHHPKMQCNMKSAMLSIFGAGVQNRVREFLANQVIVYTF